jgi:beta-N-acetylhexosaminidase
MTANPVWVTIDGFEPGPAAESFVRQAEPYGVILFARHLKSQAQTAELCECLHKAVPSCPPRIALDQEGGRVSRLAALGHRFPGAEEAGGDPGLAGSVAFEMGEALKSLGFDVDFAPVADLGPACRGTGLEGRLYGDAPDTVTACCAAFLEGLEKAGVAGCLKHFPGLGGSCLDSHRALPAISGSSSEREPHLVPYRRLAGRVPYVMVAHGAYECLGEERPSSLCPTAYGLLRDLGFRGLSVTDDLGMGAVSSLGPLHELAEASLAAGARVALWVSGQEKTLEAVEKLSVREAFLARRAEVEHSSVGVDAR